MGIMEKKMETTIVYREYIGIMENKMETIISCPKMVNQAENDMESGFVWRLWCKP